MSDDVFGTAGIRERVLAGWSAAPVRFREDANAEEDLALGGYVDRLVIELAQNAADAALRAGVPGRVLFEFRGNTLVVANTGTPLSAEGVESLATLRASAKRDEVESGPADGAGAGAGAAGAVGRFGVGFSAVLAVSDEPVVLSRSGGVRFSKADTAASIAALGATALDTEVRRRDGKVPVLRLPFEAEGEPPTGYDTAVILPLRDDAAASLVARLLAEAGDPLLLALPGLSRIEIETEEGTRVLEDAESRWWIHRTAGTFDHQEREHLLADRPIEERSRPFYSVLWALPRDPSTALPNVVQAPTPTEEALSLPALLLATFPLDPTRRHVAKGPLTDRLVQEAATAYANLLHQRAEATSNPQGADLAAGSYGVSAGSDGGSSGGVPSGFESGAYPDARVGSGGQGGVLHLVPTGLAAGVLDQALREAILAVLPATPIVRAVEDGALLRPRDAVVVEGSDEAFNRVLAPIVPGLIGSARQDRLALDALGVRRLELAEVVDQLGSAAADESPEWWSALYASLSSMVTDALLRESLGTLPVPLADGRLIRGARGLLLPGPELPIDVLKEFGEYGVRVVHPAAVDPALERLGAIPASPRSLLEDSAVRTAVEHSAEADDPEAVAHAVLSLVATDPTQAEGLWWLSDLLLRDSDGELVPANALVVPGSDAEAVLDDEEVAPVDAAVLERYGLPALAAVGVLATLGTITSADVALDRLPEALKDLDAIEDWAYDVAPDGSRYGATVGELTAIRDLDWIKDDAWPRVLGILGTEPDLRRALVTQVRVIGPDDRPLGVPSYSAWWIRERVLLEDGEPLAGRADPDADPVLAAFLDEAPGWTRELDPEVRAAVGLVREVGDLDADGISLVLERLADPEQEIAESDLLRFWRQLGTLPLFPGDAPDHVRVLGEDGWTEVVEAEAAVVADNPMWLQRSDLGGFVIASGAAADGLSDLLDVPLAQEVAEGKIDGDGTAADVPDLVRELVPEVPSLWWEHEELTVDGVEVSWWVDAEGAPHAATFDGLAKALAWASSRWDRRHVIRAVLNEPDRASELLTDASYD
ncbi:sacsin N-terminal ATP-binding-like domain-containing protein [Kribbella sp. NPDC058245]|uniref:sacsin N-terminal ATP-binding-like domain-containing protein n=1 Tax=Kribbella sp. NPDC058245 TaxID=3346399 RepID=UPI0036EA4EBA